MIKGFWKKLSDTEKPFFALAPMADVTDRAFRQIIAKYSHRDLPARAGVKRGGPDVFWTEFVSADGLVSKGRDKLLIDLKYSENERPIVAQLFTSKPANMKEASKIIAGLGFDGIDINMGCPDKAIEKQGAGASLIKNPELARELIKSAREGAPDLPISVKTRIGYNKDETDKWIPELLKEDISAITIHARTRKEMSKAPAKWERVAKVVEMVKKSGKEILVIGNGDVASLEDGIVKAEESGADGVMIGRAIFGNPWFFDSSRRMQIISTKEKLLAMLEHTELFEKFFDGVKNFAIMKKHYKAYASGFGGAKELRVKLMNAENAEEVSKIVTNYLKFDIA